MNFQTAETNYNNARSRYNDATHAFRCTPSATNWLKLQEAMAEYQTAWEEREEAEQVIRDREWRDKQYERRVRGTQEDPYPANY